LPKVGENLQDHLGLNAVSFVLMVGSCLLALISVLVQRERRTGKET
jgi:TRAP-type C4-dicarboxylate transport system permease small subunit